MSVSIYNFKYHIKIVDNNTKVVSYLLKNNLVIQKDNAESFFLKNDSYVKYFKYSDVTFPSTDSIDDLIQNILNMLIDGGSNEIISVDEMEKSDIVLDVSVYSDKNVQLICEKVVGAATSTHTSNHVNMNINTVSAGSVNSITRQSKEYVNVPSGKINISLISGTLASTTDDTLINDTNLIGDTINDKLMSQLGLFDDDNGIYFQYEAINSDGTTLQEVYSICKKIDGVVDKVIQTNWNVDKCDGNGPSGITINKSELNTFIFRLGTLPKSFLQVGIMNKGTAVLIHEFSVESFFAKLPIRWHISHSSANEIVSKLYMIQNNSVVLSNEKNFVQKTSKSIICPDNYYKKISSDIQEDVVFDIKLNTSFKRSKIQIDKINIINKETTGIVLWKLIKNAGILEYNGGVVPAYSQQSIADVLSLSSSQSYNELNELVLTNYTKIDPSNNGILISSGYIVGNNLTEINLTTNKNNVLYADIDGVSENMSLVIYYVNAPAEIQATVVWQEFE